MTLAKSGTYYRERLKNCVVESFADLKKLPFTTSNDIIKNPYDFLCTPQSQVARIITLSTSGTSPVLLIGELIRFVQRNKVSKNA